jgi:hypothetical protein
VTVERAEHAMKVIGREGLDHRVVDLNLDEIFEDYMAGQRPNSSASAARVTTELEPTM